MTMAKNKAEALLAPPATELKFFVISLVALYKSKKVQQYKDNTHNIGLHQFKRRIFWKN